MAELHFAAAPVVAGAALLFLLAGGCRPNAADHVTARPARHFAPPDAAARALLARALSAPRRAPLLRARAVITRWQQKGPAAVSVLDVIEASGGRFRLTYAAPEAARGRVVVSDGASVWQYEPRSQVVLKRPAARAALGAKSGGASSGAVLLMGTKAASDGDALHPEITRRAEQAAGRPTRTLLLRDAKGRLVERRWVDEATGWSLRTEEYDPASGSLSRRVELFRVSLGKPVPAALFRPAFPATARVVTARAVRVAGATGEARRLGLPTAVRGYRLRSVVRPPARPRSFLPPAAAGGETTHLVYSNGARCVSVFVTENVGAGLLHPQTGWRSVPLGARRVGFAQEEPGRGRSAVAWVRTNRRFVAIAPLPLEDLLPISRLFAGGEDLVEPE